MAVSVGSHPLSGNEKVFVARGVLAIVFAVCVFVALAVAPNGAVRIFAAFSIIDGVLALYAVYRTCDPWTTPRRSALFVEGVVECAFGIFLMFASPFAPIIALAIAANGIVGGASASVYSYGDKDTRAANWWALYGITGVILGFAVAALMAAGIPAMLIAVGVVAVIQGVTRMLVHSPTA